MSIIVEILFYALLLLTCVGNLLAFILAKWLENQSIDDSIPKFSILNSVYNLEFHRFLSKKSIKKILKNRKPILFFTYRLSLAFLWTSFLALICAVSWIFYH